MALPFGPPLKPMLAKLQTTLPSGDGWVYEPKWDGFRTIVFRDGDDLHLRSRNDRPMNRYFPEAETLLADHLPERCVVDGELVLPTTDGLDFDSLQLRLHPAASRVELLSRETPVSYVVFDVLAIDGDDLRAFSLADRLSRLEGIVDASAPVAPTEPATASAPRFWLTPRTDDPDEATRWFDELEAVGLDGLIAKRLDEPYRANERLWVKLKHRRTADCVVIGYRLHKDAKGIGSLLLGVYGDDDRLHFIGHTASFKAAERRQILEMLRPLEEDAEASVDREDMTRMPGGPSRWSAGRDLEWTAVRPELVCEVSYDFLQSGERFRHAATFLRWRDDKDPHDCTFDQLRHQPGARAARFSR